MEMQLSLMREVQPIGTSAHTRAYDVCSWGSTLERERKAAHRQACLPVLLRQHLLQKAIKAAACSGTVAVFAVNALGRSMHMVTNACYFAAMIAIAAIGRWGIPYIVKSRLLPKPAPQSPAEEFAEMYGLLLCWIAQFNRELAEAQTVVAKIGCGPMSEPDVTRHYVERRQRLIRLNERFERSAARLLEVRDSQAARKARLEQLDQNKALLQKYRQTIGKTQEPSAGTDGERLTVDLAQFVLANAAEAALREEEALLEADGIRALAAIPRIRVTDDVYSLEEEEQEEKSCSSPSGIAALPREARTST